MNVKVTVSNLHRIASKCKHVCFFNSDCLPTLDFFTNPSWMEYEYECKTTKSELSVDHWSMVQNLKSFMSKVLAIDDCSPISNPSVPISLADAIYIQHGGAPEYMCPVRSREANVPGKQSEISIVKVKKEDGPSSSSPLVDVEDLHVYDVLDDPVTVKPADTCQGYRYTISYDDDDDDEEEKSDCGGVDSSESLLKKDPLPPPLDRHSSTRIPLRHKTNRFVLAKRYRASDPDEVICLTNPETSEPVVSCQIFSAIPTLSSTVANSTAKTTSRESNCSNSSALHGYLSDGGRTLASHKNFQDARPVTAAVAVVDLQDLSTLSDPANCDKTSKRLSPRQLFKSSSFSYHRRSKSPVTSGLSSLRRPKKRSSQLDPSDNTPAESALMELHNKTLHARDFDGRRFYVIRGFRLMEFCLLLENGPLVEKCTFPESAQLLSPVGCVSKLIESLKLYLSLTNRRDRCNVVHVDVKQVEFPEEETADDISDLVSHSWSNGMLLDFAAFVQVHGYAKLIPALKIVHFGRTSTV